MHKVLALTDLEFFTFVDAIIPFLYVIAAMGYVLPVVFLFKKEPSLQIQVKEKVDLLRLNPNYNLTAGLVDHRAFFLYRCLRAQYF